MNRDKKLDIIVCLNLAAAFAFVGIGLPVIVNTVDDFARQTERIERLESRLGWLETKVDVLLDETEVNGSSSGHEVELLQ